MKLKEIRESHGITQGAFAQQIGVNRFDYNKVEKGRFLPTPEILGRVCRALDRKPLELYAREEIDLMGCLNLALGRRKGDRHKFTHRKVYRVPDEFARPYPDDFWETLGYASERDAYLDWRRSLEREYQKRKVPTGAATADEEKRKNTFAVILAKTEESVNVQA